MGLAKSRRRTPLTWWRFVSDDMPPAGPKRVGVRVVCSSGHASTLQHAVNDDGSLAPPGGQMPSCHCGVCNETLPLRLDGWTPDDFVNCVVCTRGIDRVDAVGGRCSECAQHPEWPDRLPPT